MDEINALVEALQEIGSPFLQARRPGLSPGELRSEVERSWPSHWADYIDDQVEAWWGWHNGADPTAKAGGGPSWQGCPVIAPDRTALSGVHELLTHGLAVVGHEDMRRHGIVFPLANLDGMGAEVFLHKENPNAEWRVWQHSFESGVHPLEATGDAPNPPTFSQWLVALTEAINAGRLILGSFGEIRIPEGAPWDLELFPWR